MTERKCICKYLKKLWHHNTSWTEFYWAFCCACHICSATISYKKKVIFYLSENIAGKIFTQQTWQETLDMHINSQHLHTNSCASLGGICSSFTQVAMCIKEKQNGWDNIFALKYILYNLRFFIDKSWGISALVECSQMLLKLETLCLTMAFTLDYIHTITQPLLPYCFIKCC